MPYETLEFANRDGLRLAGRLERPPDRPVEACALFAHCFTCGKDIRAAFHISRTLTASGLAVLRFDFTGLGQSEGEFAETNFTSNVNDLIAAARFMAERDLAPALLIGHSLGGERPSSRRRQPFLRSGPWRPSVRRLRRPTSSSILQASRRGSKARARPPCAWPGAKYASKDSFWRMLTVPTWRLPSSIWIVRC